MADYLDESPQKIAKEITLAAMEKIGLPGDRTPERVGDRFGRLYKVILKHVREAALEKKYD